MARLEYPIGIGGDGLNSENPYRSRILFHAKEVQKTSFTAGAENAFYDAKAFTDGLNLYTSIQSLLPSTNLEEVVSPENQKKRSQFVNARKARSLVNTSPEVAATPIDGEEVALYTPIAIQLDDRLEYNSANLGLSGTAAVNALRGGNIAQAAQASMQVTAAGISDFVQALGGSGLSDLAMVRASQGVLGRNFVSENVQNAISLVAQITVNPNLRTLFKGVQVRSYTFQFQFVPTSQKEAQAVKEIVEFFRYYAYPGIDNLGAFGYRFPERFSVVVEHCDTSGNWVRVKPKILDSYLTNVSVTYNPTASVYFDDGEPVQTNLLLAFSEYRAMNKSDVDYNKPNSDQQQDELFIDNEDPFLE